MALSRGVRNVLFLGVFLGHFFKPCAVAAVHSTDDASLEQRCVGSRVMSVIAHADDDLYFINPSIDAAILRGACIHTVIVTEGYADNPDNTARIKGLKAAYTMMLGTTEVAWREQRIAVANKSVQHFVAQSTPRIEFSFLNVRAGSHDSVQDQVPANLYQVFAEDAETLTLDESNAVYYTEQSLIDVLRALVVAYDPDTIFTLNPHRSYPVRHSKPSGDGAHPDHVIVAKLLLLAIQDWKRVKQVVAHDDYSIQDREANLDAKAAQRKTAIMKTYCAQDARGCVDAQTLRPECSLPSSGRWGEAWLCRHYPELLDRSLLHNKK